MHGSLMEALDRYLYFLSRVRWIPLSEPNHPSVVKNQVEVEVLDGDGVDGRNVPISWRS